MNFDIPDGFESVFGQLSVKPQMPRKGMTTEELIACIKHNAEIVKRAEASRRFH